VLEIEDPYLLKWGIHKGEMLHHLSMRKGSHVLERSGETGRLRSAAILAAEQEKEPKSEPGEKGKAMRGRQDRNLPQLGFRGRKKERYRCDIWADRGKIENVLPSGKGKGKGSHFAEGKSE